MYLHFTPCYESNPLYVYVYHYVKVHYLLKLLFYNKCPEHEANDNFPFDYIG